MPAPICYHKMVRLSPRRAQGSSHLGRFDDDSMSGGLERGDRTGKCIMMDQHIAGTAASSATMESSVGVREIVRNDRVNVVQSGTESVAASRQSASRVASTVSERC